MSGSMQFDEFPQLSTWLTETASVALSLHPGLADGHLALASVFEQTGNEQGALDEIAKALSLDPSESSERWSGRRRFTPVWIAGKKLRKTFRRALKEHPNYWLAYNELGFGLHGQAKYQEAIQAFRAASLAAPKYAMALSNLGVEYLQIGEFAEGLESLKQSLALDPDSGFAAANISLALRYQDKYEQALPFARKAVELNPAQDTNWLELADCLSSCAITRAKRKTLICGPRRRPSGTC